MSETAVIRARIDCETKAAAEKVLGKLGIRPTEAIRIFYRQIARRGEFPLEMREPNETTQAALEEPVEGLTRFKSVKDLMADLEANA